MISPAYLKRLRDRILDGYSGDNPPTRDSLASVADDVLEEAYDQGFEDGHDDGYNDGYDEGKSEARNDRDE